MYTARPASLEDIPGLLELCDQAHSAGVCPSVPMDKPSIEKFARDLIESPIGALFVTEKFGRLVAACGALVVPYHFNTNVLLAQGVFLWSDPQHKGTGHQVVFALERWAKDQGAQKVLLTTNDTLSGSESARGYLSRRGYIAEETNYVRTI